MSTKEVERFKTSTRLLHWTVALAAIVLAVTGLIFVVEGWGSLAQDGYTRTIHKIAAIVLMASPTLYFLFHPIASLRFLSDAFKWGKDDLDWLKAAPDYYFGGHGENMPPQGHMNTGQKLFWLISIFCTTGFAITGLIMWTNGSDGTGGFLTAAMIHQICLIVGGSMLLVHVYLGALHPKMTESLPSMIKGKISKEYAKDHYGKWYEEQTGTEKK